VTAVLSLRDASYRYPGVALESLREVSLDLAAGSRSALLGPAGCGLSTLCLVLSGLAPRVVGGQLRGSLLLAGADVRDEPMHRLCESVVLAVPQAAAQLSLVAETVYEEVAFGPANLGLPRGEVMERTEQALEQLAIGSLAARDPRRLSGGQQQLVALAGLLAMRPRVLLLDDALAHLDARAAEHLRTALTDAAETGAAILLASHDTQRVVMQSERLLVMADGRVERQGATDEVLSDPSTWALGVAEPDERRLLHLLARAAAASSAPASHETVSPSLAAILSAPQADAAPLRADSPPSRAGGVPHIVRPVDLELRGLHFAYGDGTPALRGVDLAIPGGLCLALIGPNGSGKTTLARHLDGLLRPTSGEVLIAGEDTARRRVAELAAQVAVGFQDPDRQVFARRAGDEVAFGPRQLGFDADRLRAAVTGALEATGLQGDVDRHPQDLGGAARRLLVLASLLAMQTPVIVLDEPTVGLDVAGLRRLQRIMGRLRAEGRTIVLISHDLRFVAESADRVVLLVDGRVSLDGSPVEVFAQDRWPALRAAGLEPPVAAVLGARLGLGSTPTGAALLAAARATGQAG
jgi:energy-coupling factor transport system ATP-binding protein